MTSTDLINTNASIVTRLRITLVIGDLTIDTVGIGICTVACE